MRLVSHVDTSDCWGLHIRRTRVYWFSHHRPWLFKRFPEGWAFCALGFHIFYRKRRKATLSVYPGGFNG